MSEPATAPPDPARRVVLLGASNLTRGFRHVVRLARARLGAPLEVLAAPGHGRSYGLDSSFLGRTLPPIERCGLWARLGAGAERPTSALLTDVGNDLAYGVDPGTLAGWIERALDRLQAAGARPLLTGLPLVSLEALEPARFAFWSRLFFPGRGLELARVLDAARAVQAALEQQARSRGLTLAVPRAEWFGVDPIHYPRGLAGTAWSELLAGWEGDAPGAGEPPAAPLPGRIPLPPAAVRRVLGLRLERKQPAARLADGTTLSIY